MTTKHYPLALRALSLLLAALQIAGPIQVSLRAAQPGPSSPSNNSEPPPAAATTPPAPARNNTSSQAEPPKRISFAPQFSAEPTDAELFSARIFSTALVPVGKSTPAENKALADALLRYVQHGQAEDQSILQDFLKEYPQSVWKPSLLVNLGIVWRQAGYFSRAMAAWQEAWQLSKNATDIRARALADRALGELLQINAWVGRFEAIEPLMAEIGDRELIGGATEMLAGARQGLWIMNHNPEKGFMCGPYALQQIVSVTKAKADMDKLRDAKSSRRGFSLAQVKQLADEVGLKYQMAKRKPGSPIPLYSVVHWKLNHYGAIIKQEPGRCLVQDSTFSHLYGKELWVSDAALDEEASGYFLIPEGPLPEGWETVKLEEGQNIWGKGPTSGPDPNAFTPQDQKTCPDRVQGFDDANGAFDSFAMARYSAHLMLVSLNIVDTPLRYQPPRGPAIKFKVTYNQKDWTSQPIPNYSNIGSKWTFDWYSYISDNGVNGARTTVTRYVNGGGVVTHGSYNSSTGFYQSDRDGNQLQYIAASDTYQLTAPDGSVEIFSQPSTTIAIPRNMLLTQVKDPAGNSVTISYVAPASPQPANVGAIDHITDAMNQQTKFFYDLASDPYKITRIQDSFPTSGNGRTAYFDYDMNGRLRKITDVFGLESVFSYGPGDFINQLTTPYGTTTFSFTDNGAIRSLTATDPNGDQEYITYQDTAAGSYPADSEAEAPNVSGISNHYLNYRNTFYFDKKVMKLYGSSDPTKAVVYHWLHDDEINSTTPLASGLLESIKSPLESRIWFTYPNQGAATFSQGITLRSPSVIARMVDDPANPNNPVIQEYQFTYNSQGRVASITDPLSRQTTFDYYPNGLDLQKIRQTTTINSVSINDVLAEFGTYNAGAPAPYNAPHRPSTYINAARQTYNLQWNADGRIHQVTNPKSEVTQFVYDANGFYLQEIDQLWSGGTQTKKTSFAYDSYGRVKTVTDSEGYALNFAYDLLDRLTRVTYPDNTFEKYDYDRLDLIRAWDRTGVPTQMTYDGVGRPLTVKDRLGRVTRFSWCGCGALESVTDPLMHVTSWMRDIEGRVTQKNYFDGKFVQYGYEPRSGNLHTVTDAKNQVTTYSYFKDGSLQGITYTAAVVPTPAVSFTYDPNYSRPATMADGVGTTTWSYYPITTGGTLGAGQISGVSGPIPGGTSFASISYSYDPLGRLLGRSIGAVNESMAYDALGRVTSHVNSLATFTPTYVGASFRLSSLTGPIHSENFGYYNNVGGQRLQSVGYEFHVPNLDVPTFFANFAYQYDTLGRMKTWNASYGPTGAIFKNMGLEYDAEGQLLDASVSSNDNGTSHGSDFTYAYDAAGNRTSEQREIALDSVPANGANPTTVSQSGYNNTVNQLGTRSGMGPLPVRFKGTVNEPAAVTVNGAAAQVLPDPASTTGGQLFSTWINLPLGNQVVPVTARDYDGANGGNVTTKNYNVNVTGDVAKTFSYDNNGNEGGSTSTGGNPTYEWDAEDRLTAVNNGTLRSEFTYDGFGRRVMIVEKNNGTVTSTKKFVWSGSWLWQERDANNNVTKTFFAEGEQIGVINYFYARDHLGSVVAMLDQNANVVAQYDYDPYGRRGGNQITSGAVEADFGFTGHYYHAPSGLHLALNRAYDADIGRWISRDRIGEGGGLNLYMYVGNNPINFVDPLGLEAGYTYGSDGMHIPSPPWGEGIEAIPGMVIGFLDWVSDAIGLTDWGGMPPSEMMNALGGHIPEFQAIRIPCEGVAVTDASIANALKGSAMKTTQKGISLPKVENYVRRLEAGETPPPIKVDGNVIVDGNHRYVAGRLVGIDPPVTPGTASPSQAAQARPIQQINVDPEPY